MSVFFVLFVEVLVYRSSSSFYRLEHNINILSRYIGNQWIEKQEQPDSDSEKVIQEKREATCIRTYLMLQKNGFY